MTVTDRQYIAMRLYYCEGWTQRKIGSALGIRQQNVSRLLTRGKRWIIERAGEEGVKSLLVEGLFRPSPTSSVTRNVGLAASRREELLDALELRMKQRATELAEVEECMAGDSFHPTHIKRNHHDQWELRYLTAHDAQSLPDSAYIQKRRGGGPANYCAAPVTCALTPRCVGCPHGA
jgi:hypothetical protein